MFILASFLNVNLFNPKIEPISIEQEKLIAQKVEQYIETHKKDANIGVVEMYKIMQDVAPMPSLESMYGENYRLFTGLYTLFTVLLLPATVSVSVRRLHDVNRSGWWYWLPLTIIGIIPLFYWYIKRGTQGDNKYGQSPIE
jgi:hypothetical protein